MSLLSRIGNVFRRDRMSREIDEEMQAHFEEAIEQGRDPEEARRAFGSVVRQREASRDVRVLPWLDSVRADVIFGWRQLAKKKVTTAAAILSLGLAIGACTSAFRLIDALLLRPLPVAAPERLYAAARQVVDFDGKLVTYDSFAYPDFRLMRAAVKDQAELIAASYAQRMDLTYGANQEMEKASFQYVSGWMFSSFGLRPALGRLLTENDDRTPGAHPFAVLSYDYWARRFGRDPGVIGRTFRMGNGGAFGPNSSYNGIYQIVGVIDKPFSGTEPGTVTDIFVPTMMHPGVVRDDWTWFRTLVQLKPGVAPEPVQAKLHAVSRAFEENRAKGFKGMTKEFLARFLAQKLILEPAAGGVSNLQQDYRRSLVILAVLVGLVLLIACANVANLMMAQAAGRAREMALRVSIGAGRWRLVQLVLIESGLLAFLAATLGGLFAWWAAPFVVGRINPPDNPARLALPADWRVLAFGVALTIGVVCLFGLAPALRASSVKPASALKGGDDPHARNRGMHALVALQVAFCSLVLLVTGLLVTTFDRLSHQPLGFTAEGVLTLDTIASPAQPPVYWEQVADRLRSVPGVQQVSIAGWPLLANNNWNGFVSVNGAPPAPVIAYFLRASPGWLDTMKMTLVSGRDFRLSDTSPGVAIVNETFVRQFLGRGNPLGIVFAKGNDRYKVIGVVKDTPYEKLRQPIQPVAFVPFHSINAAGVLEPVQQATLFVRTAGGINPLALASILRREVPRARSEFRVSNIGTQQELIDAQTIRERLLAMLAMFFSVVAVMLAGIGLYGVLDYSVLQRRREIGIRMAIGAQAGDIARRVAGDVFVMVLAGAAAGLLLGMASGRYIQSLLYGVKADDPRMLVIPCATILIAALLAAVPAVVRALRIDPVAMLRSE